MAANLALRSDRWTLRPHYSPHSTAARPHPLIHRLRFSSHRSLRPRVYAVGRSEKPGEEMPGRSGVVAGVQRDGVLQVGGEQRSEEVVTVAEVREAEGEVLDGGELGFEWKWPPWKELPQRYKLIATTSIAFVICNMDKVNLSIAIIPMSHQFGWNSSTAGLVQSSFFWGYALSQLPGGWLAKLFGGRKVLEVGVFVWSLATILVPFVAGFMPGLVLSRILVGIGEGVSPSAATDLIARSIPLQERSRAVAVVFGGLSVGSVLGLLLAPSIIQNFGWESVFYMFGLIGIIWCIIFEFVEEGQSMFGREDIFGLRQRSASVSSTPAISKNSGTTFTEMGDSIKVTVLPSLGSIVVTSFVAPFADNLILKGVETTTVRKICQTVAFLSPALCMTLSSLDLGLPHWAVVAFLTSGLALSNFALSGLYCTHQDISPEYASILLGITNTVGATPGIVGVLLTGFILDSTHSWSLSLFAPSIFFYLTGTVVWLVFASSKPQSFTEED